jgi:PAS domain S-box-containing protein
MSDIISIAQKMFIENMNDIMLILDKDNRLIHFNNAAQRAFKFNAPDAINKPVDLIISRWTELVDKLSNTHLEGSVIGVCEGEKNKNFNLSITPIRDAEGGSIGRLIILRDITELREARYTAGAASRAKSEFLSNISHEIRTHLNAIIGLAGLSLKADDSAIYRRHTEMISASGGILLNLANDILDISKIESGKLELEEINFNLHDLIWKSVESQAVVAGEKGVDFKISIDPDIELLLTGDPYRLGQVITNLAGNAVKFTEKGEVILSVKGIKSPIGGKDIGYKGSGDEDNITLFFSIKDSGIGIPQDKQERIFEGFAQADRSTVRKYGGTGLGTTISKKLVELMGGKIWFESEQGIGTTFYFIVAVKGQKASQSALKQSQLEGDSDANTLITPIISKEGKRQLKILLAEDNYFNQMMLIELLKMHGHITEVAKNGREALELWQKGGYDFILMDVHMPDMDGLEATRRIREIERIKGGRIPIIAITANAAEEDRNMCLTAGMDDYFSKPVDANELIKRLGGGISPERVPVKNKIADLLNPAGMGELSSNEKMYEKFIRLLLSDLNMEIIKIEESLKEGDYEKLRKAAHTVKGMGGRIKGKLSQLAYEIEKIGSDDRVEGAHEKFVILKKEYDNVRKEIEQNLD